MSNFTAAAWNRRSVVYLTLRDYEYLRSRDSDDNFFLVVNGVIQLTLIIVGCLGNASTIAVYIRPRVWASVNYYLIALAIADSFVLVSSFFMTALWTILEQRELVPWGSKVYILHAAFVMCNIGRSACVWFTILLTVERYLVICHPLHHLKLNNERRIKLTLATVSAFALLYNFSKVFELEAKLLPISYLYGFTERTSQNSNVTYVTRNETVFLLRPAPIYKDPVYFTVYRMAFSFLFDTVVPLSVIAALTTLMCRNLLEAHKHRIEFLLPRSNSMIPSTPKRSVVAAPTSTGRSRSISLNVFDNEFSVAETLAPPPTNNGHLPLDSSACQGQGQSQGRSPFRSPSASYSLPFMSHRTESDGQTSASVRFARLNVLRSRSPNPVLIAVLIKFVLCHTLPAIVTIIELIRKQDFYSDRRMDYLVAVSNLLVVLNSATNCLVLLCGRKFRHECALMLRQFCDKVKCLVAKRQQNGKF